MDERALKRDVAKAIARLTEMNRATAASSPPPPRRGRLRKVLVANRGEIAKRFFLSLHEEGIPSVAIVTDPDRGQTWYEFADEVVFIGDQGGYADIPTVIAAALVANANAIYSGYGFLSENADFAEGIEMTARDRGVECIFMGPSHETIRLMANKMSARRLARRSGIPLFESSELLTGSDILLAAKEASRIGYPVIVKPCSGGGGRGIAAAASESELEAAVESASRVGRELYGDPTIYLETFIPNPIHMEVQIFNGRAIGIRKCAVQRRNQKIIEESGHSFIDTETAAALITAAERMALASGYSRGGGAGTVEFLIDADTGQFGFLEVNTRLQVEYAVTDLSQGIDIARWQILYFDGREKEIVGIDRPYDHGAAMSHSIECRIYAEEPENDYLPSPGTILELDLPTFHGIRCDFGFMEGDQVLPMYDPMLGKIIVHGATRAEAILRMERALQEFYISGVRTNIGQLLRIVRHERFIRGDYTNTILKEIYPFESNEPEPLKTADQDEIRLHVLFGAFSQHLSDLSAASTEFMIVASRGSITDIPPDADIPRRYLVESDGARSMAEFLQTTIDSFHAFFNGRYAGRIILSSFNDRCDDLILLFGPSSYRIRLNRRHGTIDLRMRNRQNKIDYFRMSISPERPGGGDNRVMVLSPFQGTFVCFCRPLWPGDRVEKGMPLLVLSAMKMETIITAPATGRLVQVIEEGDAGRLMKQGRDGRPIGRSIRENELLAVIEPEETDIHGEPCTNSNTGDKINPLEQILDYASIQGITAKTHALLEMILAAVKGFIASQSLIDAMARALAEISASPQDTGAGSQHARILIDIISHYTCIKKLFSSLVSSKGLPLVEELDHYAANRGGASVSPEFSSLMDTIRASYGVEQWEGKSAMAVMAQQYLFLLCRRSYHFSLIRDDIIPSIARMLAALPDLDSDGIAALVNLMDHEQSERDDTLLKFLRKLLSSRYPDIFEHIIRGESASASAIESPADDGLIEQCARSLSQSVDDEAVPLPEPLGSWSRERLSELSRRLRLRRLYWPFDDCLLYHAVSEKNEIVSSYIAYACADLASAGSLGRAVGAAARAVRIYQRIDPAQTCWIHVLGSGCSVSWESTRNPSRLTYDALKEEAASALALISRAERIHCMVDVDVLYPYTATPCRRSLLIKREGGSVVMEPIIPMDRANPYHDPSLTSPANQRLIDAGKWPIQAWAAECFDPDTMEEICIPSIDSREASQDGDGFASRPVAARILRGTIAGLPACFFMKDSRVSGGSTGNREGLKYVAAAYLSFMNDWPLYVWNDSAGANIMEGVISLNRGAEGFMMNTLLTERTDPETFIRYLASSPDPDIASLIQEIDRMCGPFRPRSEQRRRNLQLVAVGIGSSAGLDVYGSSQASIQILLDSPESYRVLTGSKVIHTVIGEEITNYDIGGAPILGKWAGIVDLVTGDKLHLIAAIRMVHRLFAEDHSLPAIARVPIAGDRTNESIALNESMIRANVDDGLFWPFRECYYGAEGLASGFARIGGRRVLVMGPRTHGGIRTNAALIKARELLRVARRTASHRILIFGRRWWQTPNMSEEYQMRPHLDLLEELKRKDVFTIIILTHPEGIKCVEIIHAADAVIYVRGRQMRKEDRCAAKSAGFTVSSMAEAFDCACRLIQLIDPVHAPSTFTEPTETPSLPSDPAVPYDMIDSVIHPTFDAGSFLEWYREMNNPVTGPNLITGLATLEGRTVGVIADQPLVKGGGADAFGTEKFRVFVSFLNRAGIPLVMLSNSSGFVPGSQQERFRIQAIGAESLDVNILGTMPVVSVVLNQNYGGRLIHAFNKFLRPGIVFLALEQAVMAVIGVDAAFDLLYGKKYHRLIERGQSDQAQSLRSQFVREYLEKARASKDGIASKLVDWIIPTPEVLRTHLIRGMELARRRCEEAFGSTSKQD